MSSLSVSKRADRNVNASAKARAARLVRKIERAIERGEFTPSTCYLTVGECGCALAAAQYVGGLRGYQGASMRHVPGLSSAERDSLEEGYEQTGEYPATSIAFFAAGRELRKFHPEARS